MKHYCEYYFEHEPDQICKHCSLLADKYGNTEEDLQNCCFPDCGCDGARNCMAENEANNAAVSLNRERGKKQEKNKYNEWDDLDSYGPSA